MPVLNNVKLYLGDTLISGGTIAPEETILVTDWERGGLNSSNGEPSGTLQTQRLHTPDFIECKIGDVITTPAPRQMYVYFYDLDTHKFIRHGGAWTSEYTVTENVAVRFVGRIVINNTDGEHISDDDAANFYVSIKRTNGIVCPNCGYGIQMAQTADS